MDWTQKEITDALGTSPLFCAENFSVNGFSIDSRTLQPGDFFLCIKGDKHDGHAYIKHALQAGASGILIERSYFKETHNLPKNTTIFCKPNAIEALQDLARFHRKRIRASIIAVTGSNGKTSSKEILTHLLENIVGKAYVTSTTGNFNNHIGLPLSLLKAKKKDQFIVLEMGMNHSGEIAFLSRLAQPHHALITHIGDAHHEFFPDILDIARAKLEIIEGMSSQYKSSIAYHAFSPGIHIAMEMAQKANIPLCFFGMSKNNGSSSLPDNHKIKTDKLLPDNHIHLGKDLQISLDGLRFYWEGNEVYCENFHHPSMASNIMGCFSILYQAFHFSKKALLEASRNLHIQSKRRFQVIRKNRSSEKKPQILIDDTYNASPKSFLTAVTTLRQLLPHGRLALFFGEMAELGKKAKMSHENIGKHAALKGYQLLALAKSRYSSTVVKAYQQYQKGEGEIWERENLSMLVEMVKISQKLSEFDGILVKGSRSAQMDILSDQIQRLTYT